MFTPRYLIWGTEERVWPWSVYLCMIGFFFVVTAKRLTFLVERYIIC